MTDWRKHFQFKDLLTDEDVSPEQAKVIARTAAERLREHMPFDLGASERLARRFEKVCCQDSFNGVLDALYDVADQQNVWIE